MNDPDNTANDPALRSNFIQTITGMRAGDLCHEASDDLQHLIQECMETGKKGKLTLTLTVRRTGVKTVALTDEVKLAVPTPNKLPTTMFATERGELSEHDPDQRELDLKVAPIKSGEAKEAPEKPLKEAKAK